MSRIHEALKKAELERAATQGGAPLDLPAEQSNTLEEQAAGPLNGAGVATAGMPEIAPSILSPTLGGAFNLESRCASYEWNPDASRILFLNGDNDLKGTEEYRTLRSRLYHLREKKPLKKILITSALPQEGKSFTAMNLAQVMVRQHGRRVLLIDADLRGPRLHQVLGTSAGPGLSDYLEGKADEYEVMQRGQIENLYFIPSGTGIADPSELVGGGRMKLLMQRVEPLFDWIIVDSPPAIPVSDASVLAKACDGVLMVVRSMVTPADVARKAREEFPEECLIGVVLNGTREKPAEYQRYYYEAYQNRNGANKS